MLCTSFVLWATASLMMPGDGRRTRMIFAVRVLVGASMGVVFPAIHSTLVQVRPDVPWTAPCLRVALHSPFCPTRFTGT